MSPNSFLLKYRLVLWLALSAALAGCGWRGGSESQFLVDSLEDAESRLGNSQYPYFVSQPQLSGPIDISGDTRRSLTPPFPARLSFSLEVPPAAFLQFSTALIMAREVWRGRVVYVVEVEAEGETSAVFEETLLGNRANRWLDRKIDLSRWAGKTIVLSLETRTPRRQEVPWADRIQTVWGEPALVSSPTEQAAAQARDYTSSLVDWLQTRADAAGITPQDQNMFSRLAVNMLLGGLLSLLIRELYKRYGATRSNRESFANMFPLFTLVTIMVIFVVQTSVALSLGLIGALSIVRFRAAIKSTEELSYLLFCVAIGLSLGANQKTLAVVAVVIISAYVAGRSSFDMPTDRRTLLLTVSGHPERFFNRHDGSSALDVLRSSSKNLVLKRLDHVQDHAELRAIVTVNNEEEAHELMSQLRTKLPQLDVSYIDNESLL